MWVWIYYGIALLLGVNLAFLIIRKMRRSQTLSLGDCFVRVSMFANLVTLVIAVIALQMGIASYIDRKKSREDEIKQLQGLQATLESFRKALDETVSPTAQRLGAMQPGIVATTSRPASQASGRSFGRNNSAQSEPPQSLFGATVVQVAALVREADALALAKTLQQRSFPAFVVVPKTDLFYRVQVGPYTDIRSAKIARQQLESRGFECIIKRSGP